jgi:uncharacterized protein YdcH (DUF465 family)
MSFGTHLVFAYAHRFASLSAQSFPITSATRLALLQLRLTTVQSDLNLTPRHKEAHMSKSTAKRDDLFEEASFDQLRDEHQNLEKRIHMLSRSRSQSPEELAEIQRIKKRKLAIKDEMRTLGA